VPVLGGRLALGFAKRLKKRYARGNLLLVEKCEIFGWIWKIGFDYITGNSDFITVALASPKPFAEPFEHCRFAVSSEHPAPRQGLGLSGDDAGSG
jgi:hypothetical protein